MTDDTLHRGPLDGVRVLDATRTLGRYGGKILAEMGADVVRVLPGERGPDLTGSEADGGVGLLDLWHDNSCTRAPLDLDSTDGAETFRALAAAADVMIEAEPPGVMTARGLGPEALAGANPSLVQVSLSPQGADGPRAGWRSSDLVAQSLGGYLSVTGDPDNPVALWGRQAHTVGGFYAAISVLAGLRRARASGRGSHVDLSLHEAVVACSEHLLMYWWYEEAMAPFGAPIAHRQRSLHWIRAFEVVPCKRGACMVSPAAGGLLDLIAWLKARGHAEDIPDDPDADELLALVEPMMAALKAAALETDATELFEAGQSMHVPFGESFTVAQVVDCDQHLARGFFRSERAGGSGDEVRLPGPLARFGATPVPVWSRPAAVEPSDVVARWAATSASPGEPDGSAASDPSTRSGSSVPSGSSAPADRRPLAGLRVLDFSHVMAGPFATRMMADLGADVIRIQTEERTGGSGANEFPYNLMWARTKRSIQLQMKHGRATEVLQRLVEQADIVIDNFSAGVMAAWGAGPEQLAAWNQAIISISMTGCGADGPWADKVTYAPTIHALCGMTALTGPKGELDCGPGLAFNDHASGLAGVTALLAALDARGRTGRGQHIDLSQLEVGTYLVGPAVVDALVTGREAMSNGNVDPFAEFPVNDVFPCRDGNWVAVTAFGDEDVDRLMSVDGIGLTGAGVVSALGSWASTVDARSAQDVLQAAGVAAGVVQNAGHLMEDDDQLAHRQWLVETDSSIMGSQPTERHPGRWTSTGPDDVGEQIEFEYRGAPFLGEHNFEVYEELLGWDAEQVALAIGDDLIL